MTRVTQAEFARMAGVNRSTVHRWIQNGRIEADAHGLIDPDAAARMRDATESPLPHHQARKAQFDEARDGIGQGGAEKTQHAGQEAQRPATPDPMPAMEKLGAALKLETWKLQKAKAETANMELDKLAGALVERAEVDFVLHDFGQTLRALLESLPDRMAHECLRIRDAAELHKYLADTFADVLVEMSEHMKRRLEDV